jgi:hypothetical protein
MTLKPWEIFSDGAAAPVAAASKNFIQRGGNIFYKLFI